MRPRASFERRAKRHRAMSAFEAPLKLQGVGEVRARAVDEPERRARPEDSQVELAVAVPIACQGNVAGAPKNWLNEVVKLVLD